jgi:hypothetical protein
MNGLFLLACSCLYPVILARLVFCVCIVVLFCIVCVNLMLFLIMNAWNHNICPFECKEQESYEIWFFLCGYRCYSCWWSVGGKNLTCEGISRSGTSKCVCTKLCILCTTDFTTISFPCSTEVRGGYLGPEFIFLFIDAWLDKVTLAMWHSNAT